MLIPSFVGIGPLVPKKKIFEGLLPYMGWQPSGSRDQHHINNCFISLNLKANLQNLIKMAQGFLRKAGFNSDI